MTNTHEILARNLKECRLKAGLKIKKDAADRLGIPLSRYTNYELALRMPDLTMIERMAELFHTNPAYIVGWTNDPSPVTQDRRVA